MCHVVLLATAVCCSTDPALAQSPQASVPLSGDWKRVRGPAFEVVGNASPSELRRAADSLEQFRQAVRLVFPGVRTEGSSPTRVLVFRDQIAMNPFKPKVRGRRQEDVAGYFVARPDVNYLVLAPLKGARTYQLLFHEFTHHLVRLNAPQAPLWLNEGLAEMYSTFAGSDSDSRALIGRPPPSHRYVLDTETMIPLSTLLSPRASGELFRTRARTAMFYAQSWAFVHYVLLGENGRHQQGLRTFLRLQHSGLPLDEQFQRAFGMSFRDMENALRGYVHRRKVPALQLTPPEASVVDAPQPITEVEALHLQGDLLVTLGATSEAEAFLQKAARLDPAHIDTRLSLVRCRMQQDRLDDALALVEPVVSAAPDSFAAHRLHGAVLRFLERYTDAVAAYGRALKLKPDDEGSFYGASIAQVAIGQPQARETFAAVLTLDPDPSWHWSRIFDTWELGRTEYVIDDGRAYLAQRGWSTDSSVYVALAVALEHFRRGEAADAETLLAQAAEQSDAWPAKLVAFLQGRIAASKLLEHADSPGLLTEARTYIGIKALIEGRIDEGLQHLNWVKASGSRDYLEYRMALGELRRVFSESARGSAK